ncbi:aldose 1-epimerase family protein [Alteraurantiacibacter buctensis]|uniref:Aldose 1-epimerase family protein n=1 Tax=Alteraurantiacibacter buctensis TaxID=1503981 RepID=A0A844YU72_9SPHN|nr:aldose 1-epimerase family protein [Alteraurantiacibacter buctensis]MXO70652.1 aldose 1-epimerase family protein [Alteraurantiacibacter buctensis]
MTDPITITSGNLTARIDPLGAELVSLREADGRELMTSADPAHWTGHAPLLFPIVGRLNGDVLRLDGREYPMKQHGFARRLEWEVLGAGEDAVTFVLRDSATTRETYPFAFDLAVLYELEGTTLTTTVRVGNTGPEDLPFSFGFHPAFAWPLPFGQPRDEHRITFEREEGPEVVRLEGGLIATQVPSPLQVRDLPLSDALFTNDALVWAPVASQEVTYGAAEGPRLRIAFPDTPYLGIWTQPGAQFVCIEPWHGHADPAGFSGDFRTKPGVITLPPGDEWRCTMRVTLEA